MGIQVVGLADVSQLVGQGTDEHHVLDSSPFVGIERFGFTESAQDRVPEEGPAIVDFGFDPADVSIAVVFKARVPAHDVAVKQLGIVADFVGREGTGVSKRFGVVERELTAVEEVACCGDDFVSDDRKEVSDFDA